MPCKDPAHTHVWPTEGLLVIERCEKQCAFCGNEFNHAWFLRRHVKQVHKKREYQELFVSEGWSASPFGNRTKSAHSARKTRNRQSAQQTTPPAIEQLPFPNFPHVNGPSAPGRIAMSMSCAPMQQLSLSSLGGLDDMFGFDALGTTGIVSSIEDSMLSRSFESRASFNLNTAATHPKFYTTEEPSLPSFTANTDELKLLTLDPLVLNSNNDFINDPPNKAWRPIHNVRAFCHPISASMPSFDHCVAANELVSNINNSVADFMAEGRLSTPEIVFVLEQYTSYFQLGLAVS